MCTGATHERAAFSRYQHYSISRDPAEAIKREIAIAVLDTENIAHEIAVGLVRTWLRFKVQEITLPVMIDALEIKATYGLSYWDDAAIVAAARALCKSIVHFAEINPDNRMRKAGR
jgi:predicted nucleic acid-binding protein